LLEVQVDDTGSSSTGNCGVFTRDAGIAPPLGNENDETDNGAGASRMTRQLTDAYREIIIAKIFRPLVEVVTIIGLIPIIFFLQYEYSIILCYSTKKLKALIDSYFSATQ
jgi:hypothetical protein